MIFGTIIQKAKEVRNKRNERIDRIQRVEKAIKGLPAKAESEESDKEAKELSQKTGLPYEDTIEYIKYERVAKKRGDAIKGIVVGILKAGKQSAENIERSGMFGNGESVIDYDKIKGNSGSESLIDYDKIRGHGNESIFRDSGQHESIFKTQNRGKKHKKRYNKSKRQVVINI